MEKDKLLKNVPLEMLGEIKKLSARLWAENNPVAVQLSVIIEEFEAESSALEGLFLNYEKHYAEKSAALEADRAAEAARLGSEITALKEQVRGLEDNLLSGAAAIKGLKAALEKSETEGSTKYTREEVNMLEQQILELKKELSEFRQLKEMDDRKIIELEAMVATKADEVERRYIGKTTFLEKESAELKAKVEELEKSKQDDDASIKEFKSALEKSKVESRSKYSREEVDLLEHQILELKKEVSEFRQLKEMDDRRIMELDAMLVTKAEEVERRFIGKTSYLEKENGEVKAKLAELEKAKEEDDTRIKDLRSALDKSKIESRDKYTRQEVDMLEQQILDLKKELSEFRQLKELDERKIAELDELLAAKTGDIENKFIGRISMLENKVSELRSCSEVLEGTNIENEKRIAEMKKLLALKDREISSRYPETEVKQLEGMLSELRQESAGLKVIKLADEKKISELSRALEERKDEMDKKYVGKISALEEQAGELKKELAELEAKGAENSLKAVELKKSLVAKDKENMDLKARLADAEIEFSSKMNGLKDTYLMEQRRQGEMAGKMDEEALAKLQARKKELETEYLEKLNRLKDKTGALEAEFEIKMRNLTMRERAIEADFDANKRELIKAFDKIRVELERRESVVAEREARLAPPGPAATGPKAG